MLLVESEEDELLVLLCCDLVGEVARPCWNIVAALDWRSLLLDIARMQERVKAGSGAWDPSNLS
jgi:hypothetical protein